MASKYWTATCTSSSPPTSGSATWMRKFKARAPVGLTDHVRDLRLVGPDGKAWGRPADPAPGTLPPPGHIFHKNQKLFKPHNERGWSSQVQLDAMAEEGIDVAILYPSRGLNVLSVPDLDAAFAAALARAYNDWLYDFCQADPVKMIGAGMISPFDIDRAVQEAERCVKQLGFRAIFLRANIVNGHNWHEPYYEPLWSALEDLGVPLGFHEANNSLAHQAGENFGYDFMLRHTYAHPVEQMLAVGAFCGGGILDRHPKLTSRISRRQLRLAAVSALALGRALGAVRRSMGAGVAAAAELLFQTPMLRVSRMRRRAGEIHHRLYRQRTAGLLHRLPPCRHQVSPRRRAFSRTAHRR